MPVRHLNFTSRVKLTREQANIRIHPGAPASFDAALSLPELPKSARVYVEAYHGTTRMRFGFGTVGQIETPPSAQRLLTDFDDWQQILFRIKVTDVTDTPGKILAWANGIKPKGPDDENQDDLVRWKDADLDGRLWDMEFNEGAHGGPVVLIDKSVTVAKAAQDNGFVAAVYPEVLRRALAQALLRDKASEEDAEHWFRRWYKGFLVERLGMRPVPPDDRPEERWDWIDDAVAAFGRQFRVVNNWLLAEKTKGGG